MEFDKSKVYTPFNADELKVGSKIIVADDLGTLKQIITNVTNDTLPCEQQTIKDIKSEYFKERFVTNRGDFILCYLISEPEEKKLKWTDLKIGDIVYEKNGTETRMVTAIDTSDEPTCEEDICHIGLGDWWVSDEELEDWEKVE